MVVAEGFRVTAGNGYGPDILRVVPDLIVRVGLGDSAGLSVMQPPKRGGQ